MRSVILTIALLAFAACGGPSATPDVERASTAVSSDNSIYALEAAWTDQDGAAVRLVDFNGAPVMMAMVFTNCHYACPIIIHDMKRIAKELPGDLAEEVRYVLVSLDPERDDPEALGRFAKAYGLDGSQWTLLHGDPSDVRMLAAVLDVVYKKEANGQYSHTNLVTFLDREGEILHREINPGGDPARVAGIFSRLSDTAADGDLANAAL